MTTITALCILGLLVALLSVAAWSDVRRHRIPNYVVFGGAALALLLHALLPEGNGFLSVLPGGLGLLGALKGLGIGLAVLLPLYLLRGLGAGDVKLLAMVGAFLGTVEIWGALLAVLLAGGVLSLVVAIGRGVLGRMLFNIQLMLSAGMIRVAGGGAALPDASVETAARLPYGIAIALGTIGYMLYRAHNLNLL